MPEQRKVPRPLLHPIGGTVNEPGKREDSAAYVVNLNTFERPRILIPGGEKYEFPLGTEGFRLTGSAQLAMHHYIGDNAVEVQVIHNDESHIEISGALPGNTSDKNMNALRDILVKDTPKQGKILSLPGIFPRQQMVVVESYEFSHPEDERTDSIFYTISFVRIGVGKKVQRADVKQPTPNPHSTKAPAFGPRGPKKTQPVGQRIFVMRDGARTLRAMSRIVFHNPYKWRIIYNRNHTFIDKEKLPQYKIPIHIWPMGTRFRY
jgi:hypothetical protein